jgi:DNA-binding response OmpR family regulator
MTAGFDPLVCTDGADAFQAIAAQNSDLVVLALGLPEADGWAILGRLRAEPRTSRVPVLIVTARDDAETLQRASLSGANGYLSKPFDVDKFRNLVNELVDVS